MNSPILIIDDDLEMRDSLQSLLKSGGFDTKITASADAALSYLEQEDPDAIICDVRMPRTDGLTFLEKISGRDVAPVLMISAHGDIPMAVEALQKGAHSFIEKPFDPRRLLNAVEKVVEHHRLYKRQRRLPDRLAELSGLDKILIGDCETIRSLKRDILDFSLSNANVLLIGETGTGKELVARALHDLSPKSAEPFITVDCAAITVGKFEETLFGIKDGAPGFLSQADGGTLFLDEIASMPLEFQAKILRVIETGEFCRLGGTEFENTCIRIISAANEPLENVVQRGEFRSDLLYRVNTIILNLPALRQRREDTEMLFRYFTDQFAQTYRVQLPQTTSEDIALLMSHPWLGNVRELRNMCERYVLAARRGNTSVREALRLDEQTDIPENLRGAVAAFEKKLISKALIAKEGKMDDVAEALGISRRTLNEKIVKLGLDKNKTLNQS